MKTCYFSEKHQEFRSILRTFLSSEVIPYADKWEKNRSLPRDIWKKMGEKGFLGLHYPKTFGGLEKDFFYSVILLEELGRTGYAGFRVAIALHTFMATTYLANAGSDQLKQKYLLPAIAGQKISALAITEPEAGSDLNQLKTTAIANDHEYIINGYKKFVANGTTADFVILAARTAHIAKPSSKSGAVGLSLIVVDMDSLGLKARKLDTLGWHCADIAEIKFNNVKVPKSNLIGIPNHGFFYMMKGLQLERLAAGILAIGGIDSCMKLTREYLSTRKVFNAPLNKLQVIRHRIADLATELETIRQLAYYTAWLYANNVSDLPITECSMVKLKATELARQVAQESMQFHGAYGYQNENSIARIYRDALAATIAGGASEIMRDIIAQAVLEDSTWNRL